MIEAYNSTLPYRIAFAVCFFAALGLRDWIKNPENPTRLREYLFLVVSLLLGVIYGIVHDHVTATLSAEYFLYAKGLEADPRSFRTSVTWLAIKATYGPAVFIGALMLIANNPSPKKPQLPYPHLLRLCVYPVVGAPCCAVIGGIVASMFGANTWLADAALAYTPKERVPQFLAVWGIHSGSYAGATLGTVLAIVNVGRGRKRLLTASR